MKGGVKWTRVLFMLGWLWTAAPWLGAGPEQSAPQPAKGRSDAKYEAWLKNEVRHQLVLLPYYSVFDNLEYKIEGDRVVLLGQVVRPVLKSDAEAAVKKIEGVASVDNRIEVLPLSPNDARIRRREFRAIYSDTVLSRYGIQAVPPIHIIVKGGHVTLEGVVASEADKNVDNIRANGVSGVFSVTNNLRVEK
jgi:hyperosmotically inducible protein